MNNFHNENGISMPIYITSLELENVRCFGQRQRLDLTNDCGSPARWNLVLGENGVGKTTLLQCLAWMRPVPDPSGEYAGQPDSCSLEPALDGEENNVLNSLIRDGSCLPVSLKAEFGLGQLDCPDSHHSSACATTTFAFSTEGGEMSEKQENRSSAGENVTLPPDLPIFGYGATRSPGTLRWDKDKSPDPLTTLFHNDGALYDAENILLDLDYRALKSRSSERQENRQESHTRRLEKIKEIIVRILPDINGPDDVKILGPDTIGDQEEQSGVRFQTPYGVVPLSSLSLGYQTTLTWVLDLAIRLYERYPEHEDPLSAPGIVLIDNIDHHLHPRWQLRLMTDLSFCFPAVQFVATAHSPLIVQASEAPNLIVLRKEGKEVVIRRHEESVWSWRTDQILTSDLFDVPVRSKSVEQLRERRRVLLESSERSPDEEKELVGIEQKLEELPTAEDPEVQKAMDLIRQFAKEKLED